MPRDPRSGRRYDSPAQTAARQRVADTLQCGECGRRNALSQQYREDMGDYTLLIRYCRYCQAPTTRRVEW